MRRGLLWLALLDLGRAWPRSGLAALAIAPAMLAVAFFSGQIELRRAQVLAGYEAAGAATFVVRLTGLEDSEIDALAASIRAQQKVQSVEAPYSGVTASVAADTSFLVFRNERQQEFLGGRTSVLGVDWNFDLSRDYYVDLRDVNPSAPQRVLGMPLLRAAGEARAPRPGEVLVASVLAEYVGVRVGSEATIELIYTGDEQPVVRRLEGLRLIGTFDLVGPDQGRFDPFWRFNSQGEDVLTVRSDAATGGTTTLPVVLNQEVLREFFEAVRQEHNGNQRTGTPSSARDQLVVRAANIVDVPLAETEVQQLLRQQGLEPACDKQDSRSFCLLLPERNNFQTALREQTKVGTGGAFFVSLLLALVAIGTAGVQVQRILGRWRDYGLLQALGFSPGHLLIYSAWQLGLLLAGGILVAVLVSLLLPALSATSLIIAIGAAVISAAIAAFPVLLWPLWRSPAELLRDAS